jgi:RNase P subunit RPR2
MRVDPNDVRLTVNGEELDLSTVALSPDSDAATALRLGFDPFAHMLTVITRRVESLRAEELYAARSFPGSDGCSLAWYAVLNVPGVTECNVESLRPGTVRVVVTGGENVAIAEALASALPIGVETIGRVEVEGRSNHVMRYVVRFDRPSVSGFACEQCKGLGRHGMTFTFRSERSTPMSVECSNCGGLGCVELAKWTHRNVYTITRRGDELTASRRRTRPIDDGWFNVDVDADRPVIEGSLGVVLFWALAHELGMVNVDTDARMASTTNHVIECIAACSRPLCRLPDLWEAQIDARLTETVIDEVVDGRAVRRMGKLTEVARQRAEAAHRRAIEELESAWNADADGARFNADGLDRYERIGAEIEVRTRQELTVIRDSIAGVDLYEPEWAATWWLALREWTSVGKEPDADVMADILRGLVD